MQFSDFVIRHEQDNVKVCFSIGLQPWDYIIHFKSDVDVPFILGWD